MTDVQESKKQEEGSQDPAEQLLLHLLRHPYDLIDTRRLMRQFHASPADFQNVLGKLEQYMSPSMEETEY